MSGCDGDIVGKITTGYQGWFTCEGDGSPIGGWWHWAPDRLKNCCCHNNGFISWPAMSYYPKKYDTGFQPYPDGQKSELFSSYDPCTIDVHFDMMAYAGIDTAAFQRFKPYPDGEGPVRNAITPHVADAADRHGVKWYCMWDVGGWTGMKDEIPQDWINIMGKYANRPMYARQDGKPVVAIWGFGFPDDGHAWPPEECIAVIRWLQGQGLYVIGGVPTNWREGISDSRPGYDEVYYAFDMVSPWMVGRTGETRGLDQFFVSHNAPDAKALGARGVDYQPCVMPGDLSQGARRHGDFYWRHIYNTCRVRDLNATRVGIYVSMFDEYNEGNQIAPTAETRAQQPADFDFKALDEDGVPCTADYYLRLTKDGGDMFKGRAPLQALRWTEPWPGKGPMNVNRPVALRAMANGKLVCAESGGERPLVSNRDTIGGWESFYMEYPDPEQKTVRFKACNGKYVCADMGVPNEPNGIMIPNRERAGTYETFEVYQMKDGIALKAHNGKFVQATEGGNGKLVACADQPGWWETFDIVEN